MRFICLIIIGVPNRENSIGAIDKIYAFFGFVDLFSGVDGIISKQIKLVRFIIMACTYAEYFYW